MLPTLRNPLGQLDASPLGAQASALLDRLPADYRAFLAQHNGGFVDESALTFDTGVPFHQNPSREDCVVEFFAIHPLGHRAAEGQPGDLVRLLVDHASEAFLPRDVVAIARCVQNSLLLLSLREHDHGAIHYWDWYWRYPWCKPWFEARIDAVKARFADELDRYDELPEDRRLHLQDALNEATIVRLADCLDAWLAGCRDLSETG